MEEIRKQLCEDLADRWREAETFYINNLDDSKKNKVLSLQKKCNLNKEEIGFLQGIMESMGI